MEILYSVNFGGFLGSWVIRILLVKQNVLFDEKETQTKTKEKKEGGVMLQGAIDLFQYTKCIFFV